ncbi:MAG: sigma-70 family RNA polymerase sigma factor [Planctomycetales bacterium]|nr:sigma-70 family RNA polymerase sigma factor [Planctomycetales bacterium]
MGPDNIDEESLQKCRAYLKLLANSQVDSWLRQRVDASDLVQQTLLDAVARKEQFRGSSRPELLAWLRRILANNLVDVMRHHGRAKRDMARNVSINDKIDESFRRVDAIVSRSVSASQKAVLDEQLLRLPAALDKLPEAQRRAIELHYLQGLKLFETAQKIGRSEAAVGGLLHRGLKRLNELLGD